MNQGPDFKRRNTLGLIGALGASLSAGCGGGSEASTTQTAGTTATGALTEAQGSSVAKSQASIRNAGCQSELQLPHTASTVVDTVMPLALASLTNVLDNIIPTLSTWDTHQALLSSAADGTLNLKTAFTPDEMRAHFAANIAAFTYLGENAHYYNHIGRWYEIEDAELGFRFLPDGPTVDHVRGVHVVITWPDGVLGQLYWSQPTWVRPYDVRDPKEFTDLLAAYEHAWQTGDVEARLATIEETTCSVARVADVSGHRRSRFVARTKDELRAAWNPSTAGRVLELDRLHHIVSTYYVFAAHRVVLKSGGEKVLREVVSLLPIGPGRKFVGELSYAFESKF